MTATARVLDLSNLIANQGFIIQGDAAGDLAGFSVSSAGDVNGDGTTDLIVGAPTGDNGGNYAGEAYVIFGKVGVTRANIDLTQLSASDGFIIQGDAAGDEAGWSVSAAGDVNSDGIEDLIVGARWGDNGGAEAGEAYVIFGKAGTTRANIDLTQLFVGDGFVIRGDAAGDSLGYSVSTAGDVNNDGLDDVIVGAKGSDAAGGNDNTGKAYVIFGKAGLSRANIDLTRLSASDGFIIQGDAGGDQAGWSVSGAGDVNNDGIDDLIVSAPGVDRGGPGGTDIGDAYVIYGKTGATRTNINLSNLAPGDGFIIHGASPNFHGVRSVASAGDVNGDGFADLIVGGQILVGGGYYGPTLGGEAYVIFGKGGTTRADINLENLAPGDGFIVRDSAYDGASWSVSAAGDINHDGLADFIVGAPGGDDGGTNAGVAYVLFGKAGPTRADIDLHNLAAGDGFIIKGDAAGDQAGFSVSAAGDVNHDGIDDLIVGAPNCDNGGSDAGEAYVIYGSATIGISATRPSVYVTGQTVASGQEINGTALAVPFDPNGGSDIATITFRILGTAHGKLLFDGVAVSGSVKTVLIQNLDRLSYIPGTIDGNTDTIQVTLTDKGGLKDQQTFTIAMDADVAVGTVVPVSKFGNLPYAATVAVDAEQIFDDGIKNFRGTGVALSSDFVLTAGHVVTQWGIVNGVAGLQVADSVRVTDSASQPNLVSRYLTNAAVSGDPAANIQQGEIFFPAEYTQLPSPLLEIGDPNANDIALMHFSESATAKPKAVGMVIFLDQQDFADGLVGMSIGFPGTVGNARVLVEDTGDIFGPANDYTLSDIAETDPFRNLTTAEQTQVLHAFNAQIETNILVSNGWSGGGLFLSGFADLLPKLAGVLSGGTPGLNSTFAPITLNTYFEIAAQMLAQGSVKNGNLLPWNAIVGSEVADNFVGTYRRENISGNAGADSLNGGRANDVLFGGLGADSLVGGTGDDRIAGGLSIDRLLGGDGNDTLDGGANADFLSGGAGGDVFVFTTALGPTNIDQVSDYNVAADRIELENSIFVGLASGVLAGAAFRANLTGLATDATDRIVYERDTGFLFFDADGNAAGARVQFATLSAGLALASGDFIVV